MSSDVPRFDHSLLLIADELRSVVERLTSGDDAHADVSPADALVDEIARARRVFVHGAGRSGLALRMTAMRLMHLGLDVHVIGETTTPAITEGDVLLTASGSGTTESIVRAAHTAVEAKARVALITTATESPLAELASATLVVPAAAKLDRSMTASAQYAGGLFEQTVVLVGDALFHTLWQRSGRTADELWPGHANLE
ncbi:3-hexulose-6-phosphate isomerase [Agreia sp. Leaf335]|uniref:6-phospho-3-hexuloisomerase n=1 Tax=Agreia sp. Leaf335 TaxID=1736340 RepID=UPI0006F72E83|nr:6-phospho-3-hexuloisomerase [Agreia sp. Leaf335]KQR24087.1 3-hexulose-6-phosphate isomerase [Agreia sp. Leaf335]